ASAASAARRRSARERPPRCPQGRRCGRAASGSPLRSPWEDRRGPPRCARRSPRRARAAGRVEGHRALCSGARRTRRRVDRPWGSWSRLPLDEVIDRVAEPAPLEPEALECRATRGGQPVVAARRPGGRLLPARVDESVSSEPGEQGVDRPFARHHPVQLGERADEVEPVPLLIGEQGEHAVLERSAPHLRDERVLLRCGYYAQQGTWGCRVSQEPAPAHADNVPLVAVTLASRADIPLEAFERVAWRGESIDIAPEALERIDAARAAFLRLIEQPEITVYGVTSGYGDRAGVRLGVEERALQAKQAMHAAGSFGKPLPERVARGIVLARLANFLDGHAAVSARLATAVADLPDGGRLPSVPERGNGGSGEIVALAHLFGPLME